MKQTPQKQAKIAVKITRDEAELDKGKI